MYTVQIKIQNHLTQGLFLSYLIAMKERLRVKILVLRFSEMAVKSEILFLLKMLLKLCY